MRQMDEVRKMRGLMGVPEKSAVYRALVCAAVFASSLISLWAMDWPGDTLFILLLIPAGFVFSAFFSERRLVVVKILISILMLLSLVDFFRNFMGSSLGPAGPLSLLLMRLQILHSFDLPCSRDLKYSLSVAVILVVTGGFFAVDSVYLVYASLFCLVVFLSLFYAGASFVSTVSPGASLVLASGRSRMRASLSASLVVLAASMAIGSLFFVFMPRSSLRNIRVASFDSYNLSAFFQTASSSQQASASGKTGSLRRISGSASGYFGFGESMDLNFRGSLSDDVVLKVKTSFPSYYRGCVFSSYDGREWRVSGDVEPAELNAMDGVVYLGYRGETEREIYQVFNVEKDMSNVLYASNFAARLYFPGNQIYMGGNRELFSPYYLEKGMSYACVSFRDERHYQAFAMPSPGKGERRERRGRHFYRDLIERRIRACLELPPVSGRLREFAARFSGVESDYERAVMICDEIRRACEYRLDVPPFPEGAETADYFLFESKAGYCEHFATAMAVVCRLCGLPCRVVTGFPPGTYNSFTGLYEIRESDAHAWVEVLTEDRGVVELDPTPGYSMAMAPEELEPVWKSMIDAVGRIAGTPAFGISVAFVVAAALVAVVFQSFSGGRAGGRKLRSGMAGGRGIALERRRLGASADRLFAVLASKGRPRPPCCTISEYSSSIRGEFAGAIRDYLALYEELVYSRAPSPEDFARAEAMASEIIGRLRKAGRGAV